MVVTKRAVFINYRGEDSNGYGALLYRDLIDHFGEGQVFLDAESIEAGADYVETLLGNVRSARVLLAIIGPRWLTAADATGRRRIDDPADWIRRELAEAFACGVRVVPVLTDQAELPAEADLPADIAALSRCQYRHLRRREPTSDLARLVHDLTALDPVLAAARGRTKTASSPRSDERLQQLATASWNQWTAAANDRRLVHPVPLPIRWRRSTEPVAGPVSATGYARFAPLPGLTTVEPCEGTKGELHRVYGGLPSGRLLLIGPPGSGKSAAAILLLLDALRYRREAAADDRAGIPVPVMFTLHGWDPGNGTSATQWMADKLAETYPTFHGRAGVRAATDLVKAGRVAGFLDGLDEIPEPVRPRVLKALADAPFRLVLLTRTKEAVAAASHGPLPGAVALELLPVDPADAAAYLLEPLVSPPPEPWKAISEHLASDQPPSALREALSTPLALSLLRDVYGGIGRVDELLDAERFPKAADIENHLLDHTIAAAYTARPGYPIPRYDVATAEHTLRYLATRMGERRTSDLALWDIPTWIPHRFRMAADTAASVVSNEILFGLGLGPSVGVGFGLLVGLAFGLVPNIVAASAIRETRGILIVPRRLARPTHRSTSRGLVYGLLSGISGGLLVGLAVGLVSGISGGIVAGLSIALGAGLTAAALFGLVRHTDVAESPLGPADLLRHDRNSGLMFLPAARLTIGLLAALTVRLEPGLVSGLTSRVWAAAPLLLLVGLMVGLALRESVRRAGAASSAPGSASIDIAAALVHVSVRHKVPVRLVRFLEDARRRHLLRTVGPVYQFRHATLQARLAASSDQRADVVPQRHAEGVDDAVDLVHGELGVHGDG